MEFCGHSSHYGKGFSPKTVASPFEKNFGKVARWNVESGLAVCMGCLDRELFSPKNFNIKKRTYSSQKKKIWFPLSSPRYFFWSFLTKKWRGLTMGGVRRGTLMTFLFDVSCQWNAAQNWIWLFNFSTAVARHKMQFSMHTILTAAHFFDRLV